MKECSSKESKYEEGEEILEWNILVSRLDIFIYQHKAQGLWLVTAFLSVEFLNL